MGGQCHRRASQVGRALRMGHVQLRRVALFGRTNLQNLAGATSRRARTHPDGTPNISFPQQHRVRRCGLSWDFKPYANVPGPRSALGVGGVRTWALGAFVRARACARALASLVGKGARIAVRRPGRRLRGRTRGRACVSACLRVGRHPLSMSILTRSSLEAWAWHRAGKRAVRPIVRQI